MLGGLTYGVSPFEMASAYGTLANQGKYVPPSIIIKVTDATGKVLYEHKPTGKQAISAGVAYTVTRILEQNVLYGTGTRAQLDRPAAGKTGTTEDWSDAWFCGFVPQLSTAVWVGHPEARVSMTNVHGIRVAGGTFPAEIWHKFMSRVSVDFKAAGLQPPQGADGLQPGAQHQAALRRHRLPLDDHDVEPRHDDHHSRARPPAPTRARAEHDLARHHPAAHDVAAHRQAPPRRVRSPRRQVRRRR